MCLLLLVQTTPRFILFTRDFVSYVWRSSCIEKTRWTWSPYCVLPQEDARLCTKAYGLHKKVCACKGSLEATCPRRTVLRRNEPWQIVARLCTHCKVWRCHHYLLLIQEECQVWRRAKELYTTYLGKPQLVFCSQWCYVCVDSTYGGKSRSCASWCIIQLVFPCVTLYAP